MEDYPVLSAIAVVTFRADGASSAAARLQRRFNLLGCRMTACASDGAPVLETAWDVSNPEGTKLAPAAAEALELVVGVGDASQPGSIRAEFPDGTIVSGPRFEPALAVELLPLTPSERAAARACGPKRGSGARAGLQPHVRSLCSLTPNPSVTVDRTPSPPSRSRIRCSRQSPRPSRRTCSPRA